MLIWGVAFGAQAATRAFDRIEVKTGDEEHTITVHLNIPVRYVSHVMNEANSEVGIQLQLIQTRDVELEELVQADQLSWNPSAEVPLDKLEFQGQQIGTSTLVVSFASPVKNFKIHQGRDFYRIDFIIKRPRKAVEVKTKVVPEIALGVPETRMTRTLKQLPLVIYVINLTSEQQPIDFTKVAPIPVADNNALYTTQAKVNGRDWYRLRLGFFRTMQEAKKQLKGVRNFYPKAWIDRADIEERRQALRLSGEEAVVVQPPLPVEAKQPAPQVKLPRPATALPADERLTEMMLLTRRTMTAGEYAKAIRMLGAILEEPEHAYTQEARELLGLARERNGQIAHAKAEYRAYLERYPEGEDAQRVKQRLLGLVTATQRPRERLRGEPRQEAQPRVEWETYGSLAQSYRRDTIDSPFVEEEDAVTRSEIDTFVDLNLRRRGEAYDMRMKLATSYIYDLLDEGEGDDSTLSDAYFDLEHKATRANMRLGRQRLRSSGVLGRFDGLVLGYELTPDLRVRAAAGLPVERSRDVFLHEHKQFAGLSGDVLNILENWDLSLFFVEQRVDDLIDRRAVGGEVRYFDQNRSLFGLVDYDIFYNSLNIFMLQGNWTLESQTRLYMNLDYRNAPVLLTSNALSGENNPDLYPGVVQPIESIEELLLFKAQDEIYERAKALTAETKTLALGVNWPLSRTLQVSGDFTMVNTSATSQLGTPLIPGVTPDLDIPQSSDFIAAAEATGNEFFYTLQVVKNDLLKEGDIGILSLRYSDAASSNSIRFSASSRYPLTNFLRVNPKFTVSYRQNEENDGTRLQVSPFLQMDYRLRKSITLEMETGLSWYEEDDGIEVTNFTDYFFLAGYRWDF
jgi:tetratricopeptide (TPR) repeat protein